jgi:AcrR family transcriptional regulator
MTGEKAPRQARAGSGKREQIVQAFLDAMYELGIDGATMGEVGQRSGLDRSTIHYYFRTRDDLLQESAAAIVRSYIDKKTRDIDSMTGPNRLTRVVSYMFSGEAHQPYYSTLIDELSTAGNRNPAINRLVQDIYRVFEERTLADIEADFPNVPPKRRREIAYTLVQLAEGASVYLSLGFGAERLAAARAFALSLLETVTREHEATMGRAPSSSVRASRKA